METKGKLIKVAPNSSLMLQCHLLKWRYSNARLREYLRVTFAYKGDEQAYLTRLIECRMCGEGNDI